MKTLWEAFESLSVEITFAEHGIAPPVEIRGENIISSDHAASVIC